MTTSQPIQLRVLTIAALALFMSAGASAQYKFVKIDVPLAGTIQTTPLGISNKGEIVGAFIQNPGANEVVVGFWRTNDHPATWSYLSDPAGNGTYNEASGINSARLVVGQSAVASSIAAGWLLDGGQYTAYNIAGCASTVVTGISDTGAIDGYCRNQNASYFGWLSTRGGGIAAFTIPGSVWTITGGVNAANDVVGTYYDGVTTHGYVRSSAGYIERIDYPGASATYAAGIGDSDRSSPVAICGSFKDNSGAFHGFLYSGGNYTQIDVPGGSTTNLNGVNKRGWLVGTYFDSHGKAHGFYAKPIPSASVLVDSDE